MENRWLSPFPIRTTPRRSRVSSFDLGFQSARTDGLDRRSGPAGALESAQRFRGRGREPGRRVSSRAKRRASHDDRKETDRPQPPVSDEGGDRRQAGHHSAGGRSVRVFMRSRSRLRISPRTGASERSEVAPGAGNDFKKTGGPKQSARSVCLLTARSTIQKRPSGASASLCGRGAGPQRPRTGSPNAVRSAGTGQRKSTKCRRGGPVAAQRSSGLPRRQGGSPSGADGRGCQAAGGAERSPALTDDGDREGGRGRKARQAVHQAGRERRRGATPATATPAAYRTDQ